VQQFIQHHPLQDSFITFEDEEGVTVVTIGCAAVLERQSAIIRDRLRELADRNAGRLVVNLRPVRTLSSSCLTELIEMQEECRRVGGKLVLYGLSPPLRDLLKSTGLLRVLVVAGGRREAVARFRPGEMEGPVHALSRLLGRRAAA
jgi:anti-anti-sigma factor